MNAKHVHVSGKKGRQENTSRNIDNGIFMIKRNNQIENELHEPEYYSEELHVNKMISLLIFLILR